MCAQSRARSQGWGRGPNMTEPWLESLQPACRSASCRAVHLNACLPCNRAPYAIWTRFFGGLMRTRREQHACVFCAARRGRDKEGERRDGARCRVAGVLRPKECGPSRAQNSGRFSTQEMILGVLSM